MRTNSQQHYDAIIIGSGPAGEGAAMKLVKAGQSVAMIERHPEVGGGCTHWGTIPSKALRHTVQQLADYRNSMIWQELFGYVDVTYPEMLRSANSVIGKQVSMRRSFYNRNRVRIIHGHARFVDKNTVHTLSNGATGHSFSAENFVVATGSSPYRPPELDFNHNAIHDSDTILQVDDPTPRSITIYGAGVIGCEYASIYGNLGLKVDLVNTRERLLEFLDDEITDALGYHLRNQGVVIRHNEQIDRVEPLNDGRDPAL